MFQSFSAFLIHTSEHELIGVVRDGKDVRRGFNPLFASVSCYNPWVIHWEPLVGVHSDTEQPWVGLWRERRFIPTCLLSVIFLSFDVTIRPNPHRSSMLHNALWGYTAQRARWGGSSWPCPQSYHTWEGSWGRLQYLWQWWSVTGTEATQEFRFDTKLVSCTVLIHICYGQKLRFKDPITVTLWWQQLLLGRKQDMHFKHCYINLKINCLWLKSIKKTLHWGAQSQSQWPVSVM